MIPLRAGQLADVVGGDLVSGDPGAVVTDVVIDSRRVRSGSLFVALPGEHTDGHRFLGDAASKGAAACLVALGAPVPTGMAAVGVDDPADALVGLARWVRTTVDPTVVAITGSSGKTTTKDLMAAAIGAGRTVVATPGSYNNELGVPLTCCALDADTEVLVAEVGARGVGHIAGLASWLAPDVAVVTMVGGAHLETFGSLEGVARAKAELVQALPADGVAVLNADDPRVAAMAAVAPGEVRTYGLGPGAQWRAEDVRLDPLARAAFTVRGVGVRVPVPGPHNVGNALAAIVAADAVGVGPAVAAEGLAAARVSRWRMELVRTRGEVTVLNDAYNANPASVVAALETLAAVGVPGRRWAVLGVMAELGPGSAAEHERVGETVARLDLDGLVAVGPEAAGILQGAQRAGAGQAGSGQWLAADGPDEALAVLEPHLRPGDVVLVKASRAAGLERVAGALVERFGGAVDDDDGGGRSG